MKDIAIANSLKGVQCRKCVYDESKLHGLAMYVNILCYTLHVAS